MRIELNRQGDVAESISRVPGVAVEPRSSFEPVHRTRDGALLDAEARFYGRYAWCLNAFPTAREVVAHLRRELDRVDEVDGDWQRAEVMTNVFMLSCAIAD